MKISRLILALGLGLGLTLSVTLILANSNLDIRKVVQPTSIDVGESVTYTIQLNNTGDIDITNVTLTDTLPMSTTFSHWLIKPGGVITAGKTITWTGTVTGGEQVKLSFVVSHTGSTGDIITNTAYYSQTDGNASHDATFTVGQAPGGSNLSIDKSYQPGTVSAGDFVTYTITLNNSGSSVSNVTITDTLPVSTSFERLVLDPAGGTITSAKAVTWTGMVPDEGQIELSFVVSQTGSTGDTITNTAYFSHTSGGGSNDAAFTVGAGQPGNSKLSISKNYQPATVSAGDPVTYTITLENTGDNDLTNVTLTDTLPVSTTFKQWLNQPGGVITAGKTITWTGTVSGAEQIELSFVVSHTGSTDNIITNTAYYSHTSGTGSGDAAFTVSSSGNDIYLPIILKNQ